MIRVVVEQTGETARARRPETAVVKARELLEEARRRGVRVPYASFYGPDGKLVRSRVTRTDIAAALRLGICWCGRGALRVKDGIPFCSSKHEVMWDEWSDDLRARTIVARFLAIYGRRRP